MFASTAEREDEVQGSVRLLEFCEGWRPRKVSCDGIGACRGVASERWLSTGLWCSSWLIAAIMGLGRDGGCAYSNLNGRCRPFCDDGALLEACFIEIFSFPFPDYHAEICRSFHTMNYERWELL